MYRTNVSLTVTKGDCGELLHLLGREGGLTVTLSQVDDLSIQLRERLQDKLQIISKMEAQGAVLAVATDPHKVMEKLRTQALHIEQQEQVVSQLRDGLDLLDQWRSYLIELEEATWALEERLGYVDQEDQMHHFQKQAARLNKKRQREGAGS